MYYCALNNLKKHFIQHKYDKNGHMNNHNICRVFTSIQNTIINESALQHSSQSINIDGI